LAVLDFTTEHGQAHAYRLGRGEPWTDLGARRTLTFTDPDPGAYHFLGPGPEHPGGGDADLAASDHPSGAAVLDDLVVPHPLRRRAAGRRLRRASHASLPPGAAQPEPPRAAGPG